MKTKKSPHTDIETLIPLLIGAWRRFRQLSGPPDVLQTREFRSVVSAVQTLQERFMDGKTLIGEDYFSNPELLGSYILYHWVVHYLQGMSVLGELPIVPKRVLDVCSGPVPLAFAALRHGASEVFAVDQNRAALELGGEIAGRYGVPLNIRQWNCHEGPLPIEGRFDLIMLGHCLEELFPSVSKDWQSQQQRFVSGLLNRLTPQGFLLILENSYPDANRRVLTLRDQLVQDGIAVQAPCVWKGECPALKTQKSPCYAQREFEKPYHIKEIQRAASINLGSLKMTYVIFRSPKASWPELPSDNLYRVISPPVKSFRGNRYYLCGSQGKKNMGSHLDSVPPEARAFEYLKRGELISIEDPLEKNHALDIIKGTRLSVEAACGKPLIEKNQE